MQCNTASALLICREFLEEGLGFVFRNLWGGGALLCFLASVSVIPHSKQVVDTGRGRFYAEEIGRHGLWITTYSTYTYMDGWVTNLC